MQPFFSCAAAGTRTTATFGGGTTGVTATVAKTVAGGQSMGYHMRKFRLYLSDTPKAGFKLHPAFSRNGDQKAKIYFAAYDGTLYDVSASAYLLNDEQVGDFTATTGDKLCSIAGAKPACGLTQTLSRAKVRLAAANRGAGWGLKDILSASASQMLMMVEYATLNMQTAIGLGVVNIGDDGTNRAVNTGATSSLGNASGMAAGTGGLVPVSYRGEENLWGNMSRHTDGLNIECGGLHYAWYADYGFADDIKTSPYKKAGFTLAKKEGYISAFGWSQDCDFLFLPTETLGDSALPAGDYFTQNHSSAGFLTGRLGLYWYAVMQNGAYCVTANSSSGAYNRYVGGVLMYIPQ